MRMKCNCDMCQTVRKRVESFWGVAQTWTNLPDGPFIGPVREVAPTPPPKAAPSLCACGAELMGNLAKRVNLKCGDCAMAEALPGRPRTSLDQRIAEAQPPKVDKDPTEAWGAGQTPGYEWP